MSKINKTVEIVTSTTKSLSSMSSKSRQDAKAILEKRYSDVRITDVKTADDLGRVLARRPDLVFLGMKFVRDETKPEPKFLWLSEEFSKAGIAFTGSGGTASMLENNKLLAKQKVLENGLKT